MKIDGKDTRDIEYEYGAWVRYYPGGSSIPEVGRVTEDIGAAARVCYNHSCTAATTQKDLLRPMSTSEIQRLGDPRIGYHRFDDECPDMNPNVCYMCKHSKKGQNNE